MSRYDTYQSNAAEAPLMRKWVFRALLLSLLLHGGLFAFFRYQQLENFGPPPGERLAPPVRVFKRVNIPKIADEAERLKLPDKTPNVAKIQVPTDKPEVDEVRVAPQAPEVPKPILNEKPKLDMLGWEALTKAEANSRGAVEREMNSLAGQLLRESPKSPRQPVINVRGSNKPGEGGVGNAEGIPGMQNIDDALGKTGPLRAGEKIGISGGALFGYNESAVGPASEQMLFKIGELVKKNPAATFSIEGHTDSTGTPEYNQILSERRAEAVRDWLVEKFGIAPGRIQTVGYGSNKLLVGPDQWKFPLRTQENIEEQAPNRRVEIVIKTNRK
jgi:outer membrane protein OmpA-like peptidoglycan-associated protein